MSMNGAEPGRMSALARGPTPVSFQLRAQRLESGGILVRQHGAPLLRDGDAGPFAEVENRLTQPVRATFFSSFRV